MLDRASQFSFSLDPLIAEAKRRMRRRRLLLTAVAVSMLGGALGIALAGGLPNGSGGAGAIVPRRISNPIPASVLADCGSGVSGQAFRVYACMSGGAAAGYPHPKELVVVRSGRSSLAYPASRVGELAVRDGEVVATYNLDVVRVTGSRIVPLLTKGELASALHLRSSAFLVMGIYELRIDAHRDVHFVASVLRRGRRGCRNPLLERTAAGAVRQIRASTSHNGICS